jgi:hypothetical protein
MEGDNYGAYIVSAFIVKCTNISALPILSAVDATELAIYTERACHG